MSSIIDTHIHLDFEDFSNDLEQVIQESKMTGVSHFLIPGASLATLQRAINIAKHYPEVFFAVGIHPYHNNEILSNQQPLDSLVNFSMQKECVGFDCIPPILESFFASWKKMLHSDTAIWNQNSLVMLESNIQSKTCKAIGECGLDFFRFDTQTLGIQGIITEALSQILCFCKQIEYALHYDLPLILHVRDNAQNFMASFSVLEILRFYQNATHTNLDSLQGQNSKLRGVFHCFNAYEKLLEMQEDFYYGIGGILTFKGAKELVEILPKIPLNRILLETDSPYLTPTPHRGKRNESKFLPFITKKMSEILAIPEEEIKEITTQNAKNLFRI